MLFFCRETQIETTSDVETNDAISPTNVVDAHSPAPIEIEEPSENTMAEQKPVRESTLAMPPPKKLPHKKRSVRVYIKITHVFVVRRHAKRQFVATRNKKTKQRQKSSTNKHGFVLYSV